MSSFPNSNTVRALDALGWSAFFQSQLEALAEPLLPARVALATRRHYHLLSADGPLEAAVAGRLAHLAADDGDLPTVGDWVGVRAQDSQGPRTIAHVLERRTCFARRAAGKRMDRQVVAANIDRVLVVTSLDGDANPRRLERYLAAAAASGAAPAVVLSKADLADDPAPFEASVRAVAREVPLLVVSALRGDGIAELRALLRPGETVAILGSSGVGKSALVNCLLGDDRQAVGAVREHDRRGKHTTTHRELLPMPGGALLIDTPGMRELGVWTEGGGPGGFGDIDALARTCRFRDCAHGGEPGCAVAEAIERGELAPERMASYEKLGRELERLHRVTDPRARHEEKRRRQRFARSVRARPKP